MAARFWVDGGVNNNWGTLGNWSTTSGGAGGSAVPLATDDVTFDGGGNVPCLTQNAQRVCLSLTVTSGYTNTITFSASGGVNVSGSITFGHSGFTISDSGTSLGLKMITTGTWTTNGMVITVPVVIGTVVSFTCTLADALTISNSLTLSNSTSTTFSGAFDITATSATASGSQTITLSGDVTINGLTTNTSGPNVFNGASFKWKTEGLTCGNVPTTGTATFEFIGTGTWQTGSSVGTLTNNVRIAAGGGTLTISGSIYYLDGTITYVSGTLVTTGSTLNLPASTTTTFDTAGMSWNNITLTSNTVTYTLTINSLLSVDGILSLPNTNQTITFAGTTGFTVATLSHVNKTATTTYVFQAGATYTITASFVAFAANTNNRFLYVSSSPGTAVNFVLGPSASQDVGSLDPTDMDASGGLAIFTYHGTITTSPNWINAYPGGEEFGGVRVFGYAG